MFLRIRTYRRATSLTPSSRITIAQVLSQIRKFNRISISTFVAGSKFFTSWSASCRSPLLRLGCRVRSATTITINSWHLECASVHGNVKQVFRHRWTLKLYRPNLTLLNRVNLCKSWVVLSSNINNLLLFLVSYSYFRCQLKLSVRALILILW